MKIFRKTKVAIRFAKNTSKLAVKINMRITIGNADRKAAIPRGSSENRAHCTPIIEVKTSLGALSGLVEGKSSVRVTEIRNTKVAQTYQ